MTGPDPLVLKRLAGAVETAIAGRSDLLVMGICGAQGSGKSTLAAALQARLAAGGIAAATLSLDDLYLPRAARAALARTVHPLFATRGVPGTHDPALGLATLAAVARGEPAPLPRFDKGRDDRVPAADWPRAPAGTRVLLFEGWCLGARPQSAAALAVPVNALEADEDPHAIWRRHANACLAGPYQDLFARVDRLVLLAAPGWEAVARWREEAEVSLRRAGAPQAMDAAAIARFIQLYQRLTEWTLAEMPARADLVVPLGPTRDVLAIG